MAPSPIEIGGLPLRPLRELSGARGAIIMLDHPPDGLRVMMVGREGVEPSTSRLSGVRSNHLSYRPPQSPAGDKAAGGVSQLRLHFPVWEAFPVMKGHEDGGNVLWTGGGKRELFLPP